MHGPLEGTKVDLPCSGTVRRFCVDKVLWFGILVGIYVVAYLCVLKYGV